MLRLDEKGAEKSARGVLRHSFRGVDCGLAALLRSLDWLERPLPR